MARNASLVPHRRRGTRTQRAGAVASAPGSAPVLDAPAEVAPPDDVATVYGWLRRLGADAAETEELLAEVLRRSRDPAPICLRAASHATRLQFLTIQSVLRRRGVI
ncbi:MAG: hypothetical protein JWR45_3194 [Blastococcus sp.]|jgi:hypothetical protein|nr:hypothetical protein [Blastococcus sp.]